MNDTIGFIDLGQMGAPMACNLVKTGCKYFALQVHA